MLAACGSLNRFDERPTPTPANAPQLTQTAGALALEQALAQSTQAESGPATPNPFISRPVQGLGVTFMLPSGVASGMKSEMVASTNLSGTESAPESILLRLENYADANSTHQPELRVIPLVPYAARDPRAAQEIENLRRLLKEQPLQPPGIPVLPPSDEHQLVVGRVQYLGFPGGSGVRFITQSASGLPPINNQGLKYVYQAVSDDGAYLVSAVFPVEAPFLAQSAEPASPLPAEGVAYPFASAAEAVADIYADYANQVLQKINAAPNPAFFPDLSLLDAMVTSLDLKPVIAAPTSVASSLVVAVQVTGGPPGVRLTPLPGAAQIPGATPSTPGAGVINCTNMAQFVSETTPDGSVFAPGQVFTKTWTLRNAGSCTWTPNYTMIFASGDKMGEATAYPLGQTVPPNGQAQVTISLNAPQQPGNFQGNWQLMSDAGQTFGLGAGGGSPLWVKITVSQVGNELGLGAPEWLDTFDKKTDPNWYLIADSTLKTEIITGALVLTSQQPVGDRWIVAQYPAVGSIYLESRFLTGPACAGRDGYGLILRAVSDADGIVDSGYIVGLTCSGEYRMYRLDKGVFRSILPWTSSPAIRVGPNQANSLGVWANGAEFKIYINGQEVAQAYDEQAFMGMFGIFINGAASQNFQVSVDEIAYWLTNR